MLVQLLYLSVLRSIFVIPLNAEEKSASAFMTFSPAKTFKFRESQNEEMKFSPFASD